MKNVVYMLVGVGLGAALAVMIMQGKDGSNSGTDLPDAGNLSAVPDPGGTADDSLKPETARNDGWSAERSAESHNAMGDPSPEHKTAAFRELMAKVWSGNATPEEQLEFWQQMRASDEIDQYIKAKEEATPVHSEDIGAQMNLANLYVAKIYSSPAGPEQGLWAAKAEERWRAVLTTDPNHWEAQRSVAFSLSQYPEFLNMTGAAINEYEKVLTIQENRDPEPRFANTYLELYRLYEKKGDRGNAVDVLKQGLEQFPDNEALIDQWNSVSTLGIPE
jgi:tetratricopeptide (TPR) repeat protein